MYNTLHTYDFSEEYIVLHYTYKSAYQSNYKRRAKTDKRRTKTEGAKAAALEVSSLVEVTSVLKVWAR